MPLKLNLFNIVLHFFLGEKTFYLTFGLTSRLPCSSSHILDRCYQVMHVCSKILHILVDLPDASLAENLSLVLDRDSEGLDIRYVAGKVCLIMFAVQGARNPT